MMSSFILALFILINSSIGTPEISNTELFNENSTYLCILKLYTQLENSFTLFIYNKDVFSNQIWQNISPKTVLSSIKNTKKIINNIFYKNILMILDSISSLDIWLQHLRKSPNWNPRAFFIINIKNNKNITAVFELAWKYYIIHINIVVWNNTKSEVYTYFPYGYNNCSINLDSSLVLSCDTELTSSTFPSKVPQKFSGCNIRIMAYKIPPYMMKTTGKMNDPNSVGIEITLLRTITKWLNLTENYLEHNFTYWGVKFPNKTYSNIYNALYNRDTDIMVGMVPMDVYYMDDFDNTAVYLIEGLVWWVPSAKQQPRWKNVAKIYQPFVWLCVLLSFIVNSIIWWVVSKYKETPKVSLNFFGCSMASWYILLQGSVKFPKSMVMKLIYIAWVLFALLFYTTFQSKLVSVLTKPQYEHQISNVQELITSELSFGFLPSLTRFFSDPNSKIDKYILNNFEVCPLSEECLNRTAFQADFAVMKNRRPPLYNMKKTYMSKDGRRLIYSFEDSIMVFPHMVFTKGHPLFEKINDVILRIQNSGFLQKWEDDVTHSKEYPKDHLEPLTLDNLTISFMALAIGYTLSLFVCLCEIFYKKIFDNVGLSF